MDLQFSFDPIHYHLTGVSGTSDSIQSFPDLIRLFQLQLAHYTRPVASDQCAYRLDLDKKSRHVCEIRQFHPNISLLNKGYNDRT